MADEIMEPCYWLVHAFTINQNTCRTCFAIKPPQLLRASALNHSESVSGLTPKRFERDLTDGRFWHEGSKYASQTSRLYSAE